MTDRAVEKHWYDNIRLSCSLGKQCKKKDLEIVEKGFSDFLNAYLASASECSEITDKSKLEQKREKSNAYVDGLLSHGGPSTDVFVIKLGQEKTAKFFHEVLFG